MPECSVSRKMWADLSLTELYSILKLRTDVFFVEQKIDEEELDWRDAEPTTEHWWIAGEGNATASYLRTIVDAEPEHLDAVRLIGRVVTDPASRGQGLSSVLLKAVIETYGHEPMLLHAQEYIAPLYAKFGFEAFGDVFVEAGIPHISMYRAATS
ncbi:GNAT family N-acetyltransferase [Glaciihabitans arcticus]|uniref:GNAT family N-acetyltransferase n=1 Tax=Glaciihabitans arcticus TaxID=2668039 RepID=A0A4Q9GXW1_9MICO|nr:GNAT family N-acetyltransferase [Glaciihabitans arcticus]TBN57603.1 GNAT family N-acetyltransferase [Glaciihabitans arcticus]